MALFSLPTPQCLPESLLVITLNSLCQTGCWVRKGEQMSFQNAAPLSLPLLSNRREAEKEGRGQALTLPQVEEGQVVGAGPSAKFLPLSRAPFLSAPPLARAGVTTNHRILGHQRQTTFSPSQPFTTVLPLVLLLNWHFLLY